MTQTSQGCKEEEKGEQGSGHRVVGLENLRGGEEVACTRKVKKVHGREEI